MTLPDKTFRLRGERSYCQARRVDDLLFISGTVSWDDDFKVVGEGDFALQLANIYHDIDRTLHHFGLTSSSLIKETIYTLDMETLISAKKHRAAALKDRGSPAATWVAIPRLVNPKFLLEIEAVAVLPRAIRATQPPQIEDARQTPTLRPAASRSYAENLYCFSHALRAGSLLFVSGVASWNTEAQVTNVGNFAAQLTTIYEALGETLAAHGAGYPNIVKETIFTCDITSMVSAAPLRMAFFGENAPPASTWVEVERLMHPDMLLQIDLIAELT